jgi:hypothetical protein
LPRHPLAPLAIALACACACACAGGAEPGLHLVEPAEPAAKTAPATSAAEPLSSVPDPGAEVIAQRWFDQLLGFDALEAYVAVAGKDKLGFAIARKWRDGLARIVFKVEEPAAIDELAALWIQNRDRSDDFFLYLTPQIFPSGATEAATAPGGKVRRLQMPRLDFEVPFTGGGLPIGELRPFLPGELAWYRLDDAAVAGEPCWVVEGRPWRKRFRFDRLELAISTRTGVALRTRYFRGDAAIRSVDVERADVQERQGRYLPIRRRISGVGTRSFELVLRNLVVDPALPERIFTSHTLRYQKFPRF